MTSKRGAAGISRKAKWAIIGAVAACALAAAGVLAWKFAPRSQAVSQSASVLVTTSLFTNPPAATAVKWRYWLQDGRVSSDVLEADIKAISDVGSSGVEVLVYQSYGAQVVEDITDYVYGSANYRAVVETVAQLAIKYNLTVDISGGPNQGAGIPSLNPDVDGYNTELVLGAYIADKDTSLGCLPPATSPNANTSSPIVSIDFNSTKDVTDQVRNGNISASVVQNRSVLLAFYYRRNGYREAAGGFAGPKPSAPASWRAFVVDHFSATGAQTIDNHRQFQPRLSLLIQKQLSPERRKAHNAKAVKFELSLQPGYGLQVDVAAAAAEVDVPEIESLTVPSVDQARQFGGGVHLAQRKLLSTELGAALLEAYAQRMGDIINLANVQALTTWPGMTAFGFAYSEMHGPRMPAWQHYRGYTDQLSRTQYILKKGVEKVDLVIYRHEFDLSPPSPFGSSLAQAGYSYDYDSPFNFNLTCANVTDKKLCATGPAYKALILKQQGDITYSAELKILEYAQASLPIIVIGKVPNYIPGYEEGTQKRDGVRKAMDQLVKTANVRVVNSTQDVFAALDSLGVRPAAKRTTSLNQLTYSVHRAQVDAGATTDYYWMYNAGNETAVFDVEFERAPNANAFVMNSWSGVVHALAVLTRLQPAVVAVPGIVLRPGETTVYAFINSSAFEGAVELQGYADASVAFTVSTVSNSSQSKVANLKLKVVPSLNLTRWNLTVTTWKAPADLQNYTSTQVVLPTIALDGLKPWSSIPGLESVSGIGAYESMFSWQADPLEFGAELRLGTVSHTVKVQLNGADLSAVDSANPVVDFPRRFTQGGNRLLVIAGTTLLNALNAVDPANITSLGGSRNATSPVLLPNQAYGLMDPVLVVPYAKTTVAVE
ncbi:hypothetical protein M427DRAFT_65436 [Gonapodya prolifera JEL478]|uniref:Glycoside hydrolase family 2 protein n=1 Tax=Gonapodya prolifera (strain JEL478) TaxID=1344416 RepID=A0A139B112_GONPJ|nr:hypothetical protein M427DRAFT_65436 [Gonapodya prolifera JEL478]|eukprot:KXS22493.1 hypothetical protein M427DRAFT_65436 [Gonapodya prolifera JEL478]